MKPKTKSVHDRLATHFIIKLRCDDEQQNPFLEVIY